MENDYPMRINKYLAVHGYATRRGADELIADGKVTINGRRAVLGDKVKETDEVTVRGARQLESYTYLLYNKPKGVVTHSAQKGEREISELVQSRLRGKTLFPVGRLDKNTTGLIILTDDGRIVGPLLSPNHSHEKEYRVKVNERIRTDFKASMEAGVDIGGYVTKPCKVTVTGRQTFRIALTEGKHHQIKRMCDALRYTVVELERVRIMHLKLGGLRSNSFRKLTKEELAKLLETLNLG